MFLVFDNPLELSDFIDIINGDFLLSFSFSINIGKLLLTEIRNSFSSGDLLVELNIRVFSITTCCLTLESTEVILFSRV